MSHTVLQKIINIVYFLGPLYFVFSELHFFCSVVIIIINTPHTFWSLEISVIIQALLVGAFYCYCGMIKQCNFRQNS